jgi:16S rRNA (cytosine967-C5)-methyltransferase
MKAGAQIATAIDLIATINDAWEQGERVPVDGVLARHYKQNRYIGSKDRQIISSYVYYILRHGAALEWWLDKAGMASSPRLLLIMALLFRDNADKAQIAALFSGGEHCPMRLFDEEYTLINKFTGKPLLDDTLPPSVHYNYPQWMEPRLKQAFGDQFIEEINALNLEAPLDLRVNTLKTTRDEVLNTLSSIGMHPTPTPHSNIGIRLSKREPIMTTKLFTQGCIEIQDEGSQILASLVTATQGQKVIDLCAGAGGKTLAIAAHMHNKGRILACDVHEKRLAQMKARLARAGVNNVTMQVITSETDSFLKRHRDSADWVLTDVPCSGSGTWRRNPDLKWRMQEHDLEEIIQKQRRILHSASRLVKIGGHLVYSTCSVFTAENEVQVEQFLAQNAGFSLVPHHPLAPQGYLRMTPHQHDTDGFFASILQRIA